jgi:hypothetical protein
MRSIMIFLLLLVSVSAQAFNVTVDSASRKISTLGDEYDEPTIYYEESTTATGYWAESLRAVTGSGGYAASNQTSTIGASGEYSEYIINFAGGVGADGWDNTFAKSSMIVHLTFDQDVYWDLDIGNSCKGNQTEFRFADSGLLCSGEARTVSGFLTAGSYRYVIAQQVYPRGTEGGGYASDGQYQNATLSISTVPVPAAVWLFGSALFGLGWFRKVKS